MQMDELRFEKILLECKEHSKRKGGNRSEQYRCICGYFTGRKYNYERHQEKCLKKQA